MKKMRYAFKMHVPIIIYIMSDMKMENLFLYSSEGLSSLYGLIVDPKNFCNKIR